MADSGGLVPQQQQVLASTSFKFDITVEKPSRPRGLPKSPPEGDVETLTLTHFTKPPRIDFETVRVGRERTRHLRVINPHDYSQEVVVEKFPHKKNFRVDLVEFTVEAEDELLLTLTWSPTEHGNCREMAQFTVDNAYRLTTVLFGKAEEPPKPKKKTGLRGRKGAAPSGEKQKENIPPPFRPALQSKENIPPPTRTTVRRPKTSQPAQKLAKAPTVKQSVKKSVMEETKYVENYTVQENVVTLDVPAEQFGETFVKKPAVVLSPEDETMIAEKSSTDIHHSEVKPVMGATFIHGANVGVETGDTFVHDNGTFGATFVKGCNSEEGTGATVAQVSNSEEESGSTFFQGSNSGDNTIVLNSMNVTTSEETYRDSLAASQQPIVAGNATFVNNTTVGRVSELGSVIEDPALHSTVLGGPIVSTSLQDSPHKQHQRSSKPKLNWKSLGRLTSLTPIRKRQSQMNNFHELGESIMETEEILVEEHCIIETEEIVEERYEEEVTEIITTETWTQNEKGEKVLINRDETREVSEQVREFTTVNRKLVQDDSAFDALPDTPSRRITFLKDDPEFPVTPVNRMTFQKDDPEFPVTPVNRMTFQKDDPEFPVTPVNRMTFQKDDPSLPNTPINRMTFDGPCTPGAQMNFLKEDPALPDTPSHRMTYVKDGPMTPGVEMEFLKDDRALPNTPKNRMTFVKDDHSLHDGPLTPGVKMDFLKDDPTFQATPTNRMTFVKDDPSLPVTPARRNTFLKDMPAMNNTPVILSPPPMSHLTKSASPAKHTPEIDFQLQFCDDSQISTKGPKPQQRTPRSSLRRSGTYTKLNSSLSPKPRHRLQFGHEKFDHDDVVVDEDGGMSPESVQYGTPLSTPEKMHNPEAVMEDIIHPLGTAACHTPVMDPTSSAVALEEFRDTPLTPLNLRKSSMATDQEEYLEQLIHQYLPETVLEEDELRNEIEEDDFSTNESCMADFEESITEARNLLARESLLNPDMDASLVQVRKLLALEKDTKQDSLQEASRILHNLSSQNDSIAEVQHLLMNASHSFSVASPALSRGIELPKEDVFITALVEERIKAEETVPAQFSPDSLERGSPVSSLCSEDIDQPSRIGLKHRQDRSLFHVTFSEDTKGGLDESFAKMVTEKDACKDTSVVDDKPLTLGDLCEGIGSDVIHGQFEQVEIKQNVEEVEKCEMAVKSPENDHVGDSLQLEDLAHQENVTAEQFNDSFSRNVMSNEVKEEMQHRLSSTPVANSSEPKDRSFAPASELPLIYVRTPSPGKSRRISTLTVTKETSSFDIGGPEQKRLSRKELFSIPEPTNQRRVSTLTVTKSKPDVLQAPSSDVSPHSSRQLFNDSTSSLDHSVSPVTSPHGKILPTRFATHESPMGDGQPVRDHLSPTGMHIAPKSPTRIPSPSVSKRSVSPTYEFFPGRHVDDGPRSPRPSLTFHPGLPKTPIGFHISLDNGQNLPIESPLIILPHVDEKHDFPVHTRKEFPRQHAKPPSSKHERGRTHTKEPSPAITTKPIIAKPPMRTTGKDKKQESRGVFGRKNRVAPDTGKRSSSSGPTATRTTEESSTSKNTLSKRPSSVDRGMGGRTALTGSVKSKQLARPHANKLSQAMPLRSDDKRLNQSLTLRRQAALSNINKSSSSGNKMNQRTTPGLAKSKLVLIKKAVTSGLPKHPMPFAAKNMYYDERWMEKQERGFICWLNFVLTPPEEEGTDKAKQTVDAGKLLFDAQKAGSMVKVAPSKETLSFRSYSAKRRLNRLRRNACLLFQTEAVITVQEKLEREVACGRLLIRKDRQVHADLGLKHTVLSLILCYNPLWMRIGLETVYGEVLPVLDNLDLQGLARYVVTRMLANPDIAAEYSHPTVPHLYRDGYVGAMNKFMLKKFLLLVLFLDKAKMARLIDHDPCLFCKDAQYKASKDLLVHFSRELLSGEGDITKHLGYMGYTVRHVQTAKHEYDYAVTNLAVDLRDGVRLTRVVEFLSSQWGLSDDLRIPAISRLQKVHNVAVVFKALLQMGLDLKTAASARDAVEAKDVTDGHRQKTLKLLWSLICKFQVDSLINVEQLHEEIGFLKEDLVVKARLQAVLNYEEDEEGQQRRDSLAPETYTDSPRLRLLLQWCRAVCGYYGIKLENFTVSFSDGRALCYLVHHYQPGVLPRQLIHDNTSLTHTGDGEDADPTNASFNSEDSFSENWTQTFSTADGSRPEVFEELLSNERSNFRVLYEKVAELGGIPLMVKAADMSNTIPDEKVTITYVAYLCSRLLDIREETRAARKIQTWWRCHAINRHKHKNKERMIAAVVLQRCARRWLARRNTAAAVIQRQWREVNLRRIQARCGKAVTTIQHAVHLWLWRRQRVRATVLLQATWRGYQQRTSYTQELKARRLAAVTIQSAVRGCLGRRLAHKHRSARVIQSVIRMYVVRKSYIHQQLAAVTIQKHVRGFLRRRSYQRIVHAVTVIQRQFRAREDGRRERENYLRICRAASIIQIAVRCRHARKVAAVTTIRAVYLGYRARRQYTMLLTAVVACQRRYRATAEARAVFMRYHAVRGATLVLQGWARGCAARKQLAMKRQAAITIQIAWRRHTEEKRYLEIRKAVTVLQERCRAWIAGKQVRHYVSLQHAAAIIIQSHYRRHCHRTQYLRLRSATVLAQSHVRCRHAVRAYRATRAAAVTVQRAWRARREMRVVRQQFTDKRTACLKIQTAWRKTHAMREYQCQRIAIVNVQSLIRAKQQRMKFLRLKAAVVLIQAMWRGELETREIQHEFLEKKFACIKIQACYRGHTARKVYKAQLSMIVKVQSLIRRFIQLQNFKTLKNAVVVIQRRWRAELQSRELQHNFEEKKIACVQIQAWYRGWKAQKEYRTHVERIVKVQSLVRRFVQQKRFMRLKAASKIIQSRWRAELLSRKVQTDFLERRTACVKIQASFRAYKARKACQKEIRSIVKVQSLVKRFVQQKSFMRVKAATVIIQSRWRAELQGRKVQSEFLETRKACVKIQAFYRGYKARKECTNEIQKIIKVQAIVKRFLQQRSYMRVKAAAAIIQSRWRAELQSRKVQSEFVETRKACVKIQSFYRGYKARKECTNEIQKIIKVQSIVKRFLQQKSFMRVKAATAIIQSRWRAELQSRKVQSEFVETRTACVKIQSFYRMYKARKCYRIEIERIVKVQSLVKKFVQLKLFMRLKAASVIIQSRWRAELQSQRVQAEFLLKRTACVKIQASFRGYKARKACEKEIRSIVKVQSLVKRFLQQKSFMRLKAASVTIQSRWRAELQSRKVRSEFVEARESCVKIQSAYRRYRVVKAYKHKVESIKLIQSSVKGYIARKRFLRLKAAVVLCQTTWRANKLAQTCHREFSATKNAAVKIQSVYRMFKERQRYVSTLRGIKKIQSLVRMKQTRMRYVRQKAATVILQYRWRAILQGRKIREDYQRTRHAVVKIQTLYRKHAGQRRFLKMKSAAVSIQTVFRRFSARREYLRKREACQTLQKYVRATLLARKQREKYVESRMAAIRIQSCFRGYRERWRYCEVQSSVLCLQKNVRRFQAQKSFQRLQYASIVIQQRWRATLQARVQQKHYHSIMRATIIIQSRFRGYQARQRYQQELRAVVMIQAAMRGYVVRRGYMKKLMAVAIIQKHWFAMQLAQLERAQYAAMRRAAVSVQACWRARKQRIIYQEQKLAAILIQRRFRAYQERVQFCGKVSAARKIQQFWRGIVEQRIEAETERRYLAAVKVQKMFKGYVARKQFVRIVTATVTLQSFVRMQHARKEFTAKRRAAIVLQCQWRAHVQRRKCVESYHAVKQAAVKIQKMYRGYTQRQVYNSDRKSVIRVQSVVRGWLAQRRYQKLQSAVSTIQRQFRVVKARNSFLMKRRAAVTIQSAFRRHFAVKTWSETRRKIVSLQSSVKGYLQRRSFEQLKTATVTLQRHWRNRQISSVIHTEYVMKRSATVSIQRIWRSYIQRKQYRALKSSTITIQKLVRGYLVRRDYLQKRVAVVKIQTVWRARKERIEQRKEFLKQRNAVICMQTAFRAYVVRREYIKRLDWVIKVQKLVRMRQSRKLFMRQKNAVALIQQTWRAYSLRKRMEMEREKIQKAATKIQSWWKMCETRRTFKTTVKAVVLLQSCVRKYQQRRLYCTTREAVLTIQSHWRATLQMHQQLFKFQQQKRSCVLVQSVWRGYVQKRRYQQKIAASICIQRHWRALASGKTQREEFLQRRQATVCVQKFVRGWIVRRRLIQRKQRVVTVQRVIRSFLVRRRIVKQRKAQQQKEQSAAVTIQHWYRRHKALQHAKKQINSVVKIQNWMRAKLTRVRYLRLLRCVQVVQRSARRYLHTRGEAAIIIQSAARRWLATRRVQTMHTAATMMQSLWRGHRVRTSISNERIHSARQRCSLAAQRATDEQRLGNRTSAALTNLLHYKQLAQVLEAVMNLDVVSALSPRCCERMVEDGAVPVLYILMKGCNRSLPHKEIVTHTVNILLNLAKYEKTMNAVYSSCPDAVETLVDLMRIHREKGPAIFAKICTLLLLFSYDSNIAKVLRSDRKFMEKMRSFHRLVERQKSACDKRELVKKKMAAAKTFNSTMPLSRPQIRPAWVLSKNNKKAQLKDPLQAIDSLIAHLALH